MLFGRAMAFDHARATLSLEQAGLYTARGRDIGAPRDKAYRQGPNAHRSRPIELL